MYAGIGQSARAGAVEALRAAFLAQQGRLVLWVPVFLGIGISLWFGLRWEPEMGHYGALAGIAALCLVGTLWTEEAFRPLPVALALICIGALLAGARAHSVAEPVLGFRYYGPVEGRIVGIDRSGSDRVRLTLDRVILQDVRRERTPDRVRISLHGEGGTTPVPGLTVMTTAHLGPPSGPVEPGGFDFQRRAWFERLGAVGYTRSPVLALAAPEGGLRMAIFDIRMSISRGIQEALPGEEGAFAAAILTGDRSGLDRPLLEDLRVTNLAHLIAISGLHMGLLTAVVFGSLRTGLSLVPPLALRLPVKKVAAVGALVAGGAYLALSGGAVSTERAFIMVAVMLGAILINRRAISIRSVALAATIILVLKPEELFSPGFQMSFAATTALVIAFKALRDMFPAWQRLPKWGQSVAAVFLASLVAGLATAPIAGAHFNRWSTFGLVANLVSVPVMGTLVMPAAVAAAVLWPVGLDWLGLWGMGLGLRWIAWVAHTVADVSYSSLGVPAPPSGVLGALMLGLIFACLWRGRARLLGVGAGLIALGFWALSDRPDILVAETGGLAGLMTEEGRVLSKPRGDGFAARSWLENDGDLIAQEAAARRGWPNDAPIYVVRGRGWENQLAEACPAHRLVVINRVVEQRPEGGCLLMDQARLRDTGATAIRMRPSGLRLDTVADRRGRRLWAP